MLKRDTRNWACNLDTYTGCHASLNVDFCYTLNRVGNATTSYRTA